LKLEERCVQSFKHKQDILGNRAPFVPIKDPSNTPGRFNPTPRVVAQEAERSMEQTLIAAASLAGPNLGIGVDAEPVRSFEKSFLERNFSREESEDIVQHDISTGTQRTAAGHWAVKEAVVKALGNAGAELGQAHEPLCEIEILRETNGGLRIQFHGRAQVAAAKIGVKEARVSLTYAKEIAYAAAVLV